MTLNKSSYERQKEKQRWRTANDPEYSEMHRMYSKAYYRRIREDEVLYERKKKANREYYRMKKMKTENEKR